ncbi:hypothetical protein GCM10025886_11740 [Tetragenococcus halophilus subsp. flandriensis]|uniref:AbrB/MazE/SpoVT family DNA-binding domain-containing protein n=1 Tax=Tetragenococcus halophilus TaxID=51669 RepID=UPI0023E9E232|nr:hypothetical protein [Tetragenococcus halophilus]GMA08023.1 hypothetical protein GCM10025886_11740 [Tetragenococcus halophilus subsp. flandriensis]
MKIMEEQGKIKKWGDTQGIVLSKEILSNANLKDQENINIAVETQNNGKKRIVIEGVTKDKKELLEELVGTVSLPKDLDVKKKKAERKQKTLIKHELHH